MLFPQTYAQSSFNQSQDAYFDSFNYLNIDYSNSNSDILQRNSPTNYSTNDYINLSHEQNAYDLINTTTNESFEMTTNIDYGLNIPTYDQLIS
jgi:uridine kinase